MSAIYICDGCGKQSELTRSGFSPHDWFERTEYEGINRTTYHACSRPCIEKVKEKFGGTGVVLPI